LQSFERQLEDLKTTKERQLNDAQSKLQSLNAYVISLEGSEARMKVEIDRKQEELANAKATIAVHDNRANQATNDYDKERQARELAQVG
jgi:peptidoglycan hydrolase CwlO-like protein